jgi:hypothetical protein
MAVRNWIRQLQVGGHVAARDYAHGVRRAVCGACPGWEVGTTSRRLGHFRLLERLGLASRVIGAKISMSRREFGGVMRTRSVYNPDIASVRIRKMTRQFSAGRFSA